jgi:hypothetical protein
MLSWQKVLEFAVEEQLRDVEFRVWTAGKLDLRLKSVDVELADSGQQRAG